MKQTWPSSFKTKKSNFFPMMPFLANTKIHQNLKAHKIMIDSKNVTILIQVNNFQA
jgi:hypothetical protein